MLLKATWLHVISWRELHTIEVRLVGPEETWLVRVSGETQKIGLMGPSGTSSGELGNDETLKSGAVSVVLGRSEVNGSGSAGRVVTLTLALRADHQLAGETLKIELGAVDAEGRRQPFRQAGTLAIAGPLDRSTRKMRSTPGASKDPTTQERARDRRPPSLSRAGQAEDDDPST